MASLNVIARKEQLKDGQALITLRLNCLKTNSPRSTEFFFFLIIKILSVTKYLKLDFFSVLSL